MAFDYINEAFKKLDLLEEQMFDTSLNGINQLSDFMNDDDTDETIRVIDPEADTDEDLKQSYVGKVIINCNVCHSHVFENKDDIIIEEDGSVNVEKQCPYCGEQEGFTIVGEIAPYSEETHVEEDSDEDSSSNETDTDESDIIEDDNKEDETKTDNSDDMNESLDDASKPVSMSRATRRITPIQEDFKEVSITTEDQKLEMSSDENGKVTVTTEPIQENTSVDNETESSMTAEAGEDVIVPVSDETEEEILSNNNVSDESADETSSEDETATEETTEEEGSEETSDESVDLDISEVDEEGVDELGESYFRKVYENVSSFKTTSVSANDHTLIVEGVITFNSGSKRRTGFMFEAADMNSRGQLRFRGYNKHLSESKDAFSLVGRVDNKKLFVESLKYNYKVNDSAIRGLVRRK